MTAIMELAALGGQLATIWLSGTAEEKAQAEQAALAAVAALKTTREQTLALHEQRMAEAQAAIDAAK